MPKLEYREKPLRAPEAAEPQQEQQQEDHFSVVDGLISEVCCL